MYCTRQDLESHHPHYGLSLSKFRASAPRCATPGAKQVSPGHATPNTAAADNAHRTKLSASPDLGLTGALPICPGHVLVAAVRVCRRMSRNQHHASCAWRRCGTSRTESAPPTAARRCGPRPSPSPACRDGHREAVLVAPPQWSALRGRSRSVLLWRWAVGPQWLLTYIYLLC